MYTMCNTFMFYLFVNNQTETKHSLCHCATQNVLLFADQILQGKAINFATSQKAVDKLRLDIATSLLRESGLSPFC